MPKLSVKIFDFIIAILLGIILFIPSIVIAILIKISSKGPVFFLQERVGYKEKTFKIYKFKTMSDERDANGELLPDDQRLGKFGKLIRSLSLDELPQLFNVLKGDMSFIGPRPLLVEYLPIYNETQKHRHDVRPGITGLAQVNGRNAISWEKKFEYDVYYAKNLSFMLDVKIALQTIEKVLKRSGVSKEGQATTEKFNGKN